MISASMARIDLGQLPPGAAHVLELSLEELVALEQGGVLLQGQRVDRPHQPQLPLELGPPAGGAGPRRQLGAGGPAHGLGLAVQVPPHGFREPLQPHAALGLVQLGPSRLLPGLGQLALGRAALAP